MEVSTHMLNWPYLTMISDPSKNSWIQIVIWITSKNESFVFVSQYENHPNLYIVILQRDKILFGRGNCESDKMYFSLNIAQYRPLIYLGKNLFKNHINLIH